MRTTAGLTLAATSMVAEDSSRVTGLTVPALLPWPVVGTIAVVAIEVAGRAEREDGAAGREDGGQQRDGQDRPDARSASAEVELVVAAVTGTAGAGSYQRSGVGGTAPSIDRVHSGRASGDGE